MTLAQHPGLPRAASLLLPLLLLCATGPATAGCTVSSSGMAFGAYQPLNVPGQLTSTPVRSDASVSVVCTNIASGGRYTIALGPSAAGSGNRVSTRYLRNSNGGSDMAFNIYTDATHTTPWGDGMGMGSAIGGSIAMGNSSQSLPVYGLIPAGQNTLKAGSFAGALTMTLSYTP